MVKKAEDVGATPSKGAAGRIAAERQKLREKMENLDRQEREEMDRARSVSGQIVAEAFAKQGIVLSGKSEAIRLARVISKVGVDEVISRFDG